MQDDNSSDMNIVNRFVPHFIWLGSMFSCGVYYYMATQVFTKTDVQADTALESTSSFPIMPVVAVAIICSIIGLVIRYKFIITSDFAEAQMSNDDLAIHEQKKIVTFSMQLYIFSLCCIDATAIFGMVIYILTQNALCMNILFGVSIVAMLLSRPPKGKPLAPKE